MSTITTDDHGLASQTPEVPQQRQGLRPLQQLRRPVQPPEAPRSRRAGLRHWVLWAVGMAAVVALLVAGVLVGLTEQLAGQVTRIPAVFAPLNASARPAPGVGQTFLLVGTDSGAASSAGPAVMLATVAPGGEHTSLVSFPRDAWVAVPGHGMTTIDTAYALGGPTLLADTVESVTGVRVDHFAAIDFAAFPAMVDAAGGINVGVAAPTSHDGVLFPAGQQHLDGRQAVAYVRQRDGLPGADLDRVRREQNGLRALVGGAAASGAVSNPIRTYELADAITRGMRVDDTMTNGDLRSLAWSLWDLRTRNMDFVTAPVTGAGMVGPQPAVFLNEAQGKDLWTAMRTNQVPGYVTGHPGSALAISPR